MRTLAGHPLNQLYPWIIVNNPILLCLRCGGEGRTPMIPKLSPAAYNAACEAWVDQHRGCMKRAA